MCVSNQVEPIFSGLFSVGSALVPPPGKGPAETGPEGGGEGVPTSLRLDTLVVSVSEDLSSLDVDVVVGLGGNGGNGLHETVLLSLLKVRATFALRDKP